MPSILSLKTLRPEIPQMEEAVLQRRAGLRLDQAMTVSVEWVVRDGEGRVVDLTGVVPEDVNDDEVTGRAEIRLREPLTLGPDGTFTVVGYSTAPTTGVVKFDVPALAVATPCVLLINVGIFDDDALVCVTDGYIIVDRSIFGESYTRTGVPTVDEIKMKLRDSGINDNYLLARIEYSLGEIAESAVQAVAYWNRIGSVNSLRYTTANFPDPDLMADGILGFLLEMTGHNYQRNHLTYQAAGVSVDDKSNYQEYFKLSMTYKDAFRQRVARTVAQAVRSGWRGIIGSPYGWLRG